MGLITGVGITAHQETIPTPATYFPNSGWVRMDDVAAASWANSSMTTIETRAATYKSAGFKVAHDIGNDWSDAAAVGHARDLLSMGVIDALLVRNEPDLNSIAAANHATLTINIANNAARLAPGAKIYGPNLSTWSLTASDAVRVWWDAWVAAGGMDACYGIGIHPYTTTLGLPGPIITSWIADLRSRIGGKHLIFPEFGFQSAWVIAIKGSWSAANEASLIAEAVAAATAGGVPICIYDGAYTLNNDGHSPLVSTTVSAGTTSATQGLNSMANVVNGMFLAFGSPATVQQILTSNTGAKTVGLDASITTTTFEAVVNKDYNQALTYWANGQWNTGTGLTPLGTALAGVI